MKRLIERFKSQTPKQAKRIRNVMLAVSGASATAATYYAHLPLEFSSAVPRSLVVIISTIGLIAAFIAQCMEVKE